MFVFLLLRCRSFKLNNCVFSLYYYYLLPLHKLFIHTISYQSKDLANYNLKKDCFIIYSNNIQILQIFGFKFFFYFL